MEKLLRNAVIGLALVAVMGLGAVSAGQVTDSTAISQAGSTIVNGWWDDTNADADSAGELTCEISGVYTGIVEDSLDTITIGQCYAMSSLESLLVPDDTVGNTPYDTIFFQYIVQNQGNGSDSITVDVTINDTSNALYFTPVAFDVVDVDSSTVISETLEVDSIRYGFNVAQEATDTFLVRFIIPDPSDAADGDSLRFTIHVMDSVGTGHYDAWPGTTAAGLLTRTVLDTYTTHRLLHCHGDTVWEYGDDQTIQNYLTISSPVMRLKKRAFASGNLPGDTITYSIYYDNDGTSDTEDTVTIVDIFPRGVTMLDTVAVLMDTNSTILRGAGDYIDLEYRYRNQWRDTLYTAVTDAESLLLINAIKVIIPPGVGAHDTVSEAGSDDNTNTVSDGDSLDADAGYVTFRVRIR